MDPLKGNPDIWVDLGGGRQVRVTHAPEPDLLPVWSYDGRRLAYVSGNPLGRPGQRRITIAAADGSGALQSFPCPGGQDIFCEPSDWLSDDRLVIGVGVQRGDVWIVSTDGHSAEPLLDEPYAERDARVFRRWIAYVSEETGKPEVYVQSISGSSKRFTISGGGGDQPVWRRDGSELFFVDPRGRLRSSRVLWTADGLPTFGTPVELPIPPIGYGHWGTQYDVSADGSRIYFMRPHENQPLREINVITGWRSLLK
jgi:Tol biopolymer transport system component